MPPLLVKAPWSVAQEIHPDLDQRLDRAIGFSALQDDARNESLKMTAWFACRKFFDLHKNFLDLHQITLAEPPTPTVDRLYDYYMTVFDRIKEIARREAPK